jgi:L-alanine-DL-glutamate epimerase-like enolase superfamily enzyme
MKVDYHSYQLPFKHPFTISKGTKTHQPTLIVSLEFMGLKGYGEAPAISYYDITVDKMIEDLEKKKNFIEKFAFTEPGRYWHYLHHLLPQNPFLVCALDIAAWDLFGKMKNKPLYDYWKLNPSTIPATDYTIGIDSIDKMVAKIKEKPWPIYKIKLGTEQDLEIMMRLREHTESVFRVDANAGWSLAKALDIIPALKELGVELVEQPLPKDRWDDMKILQANSPLPLIADESCVREEDVEKCQGHFHGINIKLTKCSGLTPAKRMIEKARELDLQVMVGSMNESTVGSAAIAQLLPLLDFVDMDGPLLLGQDLATGLSFKEGRALLTQKAGLGIEFTGPYSPVTS